MSKQLPSSILLTMVDQMKNYKISEAGEVVSTCDLGPGEVVLMLPPVASGPGRANVPVCLGCLKATGYQEQITQEEAWMYGEPPVVKLVPCSKCSWPVCCKECEDSLDHKEECEIFSSKNFKFDADADFTEKTNKLDFIAPLRLLLKIKQNPKLNVFLKYDTKNEARKKRNDEKYGSGSDKEIIQVIRDTLNLGFSEAEIQSAMGIFELYSATLDCGAIAVHEDTPKIGHACNPNTYNNSLSNGGAIYRASRPIKAGEIITAVASPKDILEQCNLFRRRRLLKEFLIDCQCDRCCDSSEFGTGYGGLSCNKCPLGVVNSTNSRNETSDWICDKCGEKRSGKECIEILEDLKKKMDEANANSKIGNILFYETILQGHGEWKNCSPNSQFMIEAMKCISYIYQYYEYVRPTLDELKIKARYCQEILKIYRKLFPLWSYPTSIVEHEEMTVTISIVFKMKEEYYEKSEVDLVLAKLYDFCDKSIDMLNLEEDRSMLEGVKSIQQMAVEAKEEQKTRVLLWDMQNGGDDEEDDGW